MAGLAKRLKDLGVKYGKVGIGVHISISVLSFSTCYLAIKNSVDVESVLQRVGLFKGNQDEQVAAVAHTIEAAEHNLESAEHKIEEAFGMQRSHPDSSDVQMGLPLATKGRESQLSGAGRGAKEVLDITSGETGSTSAGLMGGTGAVALAFLCNKALFPLRVPLTVAVTPPVWRFLVKRGFKV